MSQVMDCALYSASAAKSDVGPFEHTVPVHFDKAERTSWLLGKPASREVWIEIAVLCVLVVWLYYDIAVKLVQDWYQLPDYSYGLIVPFFVLYILIAKAKEIASAEPKPSWGGLPLLVFALLLLGVGVLGADLFLSRLSLLLLLIAMVWTFAGSRVLFKLKIVFFLLLLAIPLPTIVLNQVTFPLQLLASRLASSMLGLFGIPVLREGNVIQLAAMKLEVAEACSGIRSLMSLFTLAVVFGYFQEKRTLGRVLIAFASIPITVAANAIRIFGTGLCVQYWDPDKAEGFFHEFTGWIMFLVSLACLYGVHQLMQLFWRERKTA